MRIKCRKDRQAKRIGKSDDSHYVSMKPAGLRDLLSVEELIIEMERLIWYFNENYLHSALGCKTPNAFVN